MAKQLNVNLGFTADTSQAKAQLQDLQNQLTKLVNTSSSTNLGINTKSLNEAVHAAAQLKVHLQNAVNQNTGNLDFSKLSESLKSSGTSLQAYGDKLRSLGPAGQQAFSSLAQSVAQSEIPLRRTSALLTEMGTVLKNTIRWQISSSMLHGFMGAVSKAYGYAQDLNESLNNIRIVTGQNTDQMAKFAEKANAAAKALNTTTTEYTNASLIYFQQGLNEKQVQERTDVTIKMANVARQSATVVSDQLTAIWNNFYDGTKSLEYYADVMTALGAATASSTDEIAGGLEKFAAIGETIGLSYEYAASALATITSNTRQSEEVVGTALKTIFARIQGLNLGETLDDGVTLNKYSEALASVGISIFEANGQMKQMDDILDEMGAKWDTMNKAQQTALAQTVAGVRQYTQLIALMENWDNGDADSMKANLDTAYNSSGALQEQADIYAESWEAAKDRVDASLEDIYGKLLNDKFFIEFLDGLSKIIDRVSFLIDAMGGLKGVLTTIGALAIQIFQKDLAKGIQNAAYSMQMMTKKGRQKVADERVGFLTDAIDKVEAEGEKGYTSESQLAAGTALKGQLSLQKELLLNADKMSQEELEVNKILMDRNKILGEQAVQAAKRVEETKSKQQTTSDKIDRMAIDGVKGDDLQKTIFKEVDNTKKQIVAKTTTQAYVKDLQTARKDATLFKETLTKVKEEAQKIGKDEAIDNLIKKLEKSGAEGEETEAIIEELNRELNVSLQGSISYLADDLVGDRQVVEQYANEVKESAQATRDHSVATDNLTKDTEELKTSMANAKNMKLPHWSEGVAATASAITSLIGAVQMVSSAINTLQDPDATGWEKFSAVIMAVGMSVGMLTSAFNKNNLASMAAMVQSAATSMGMVGLSESAKAAALGFKAGELSAIEFGAALWTTLWPIGLVLAAIAALVAIIYAAVQAYNADAIAAEKAAKVAQNLAASNEEVINTYNELKQSFSAYDTAKAALEDCVEGTEEWNNQLLEVHNSVLDLLDKYPELLSYSGALIYDSETGLIKGIDENVRAVVEKDAEMDKARAQQAKMLGDLRAEEAAIKSDTTNLSRKIAGSDGLLDTQITPAESGAKSQKVDMNAFLTQNAALLAGLDSDKYKETANLLATDWLKDMGFKEDTIGFELALEALIEALVNGEKEIQALGAEYKKINNEVNNVSKMIVSQELADDLEKTSEINRKAIVQMAANTYDDNVKDYEARYTVALQNEENLAKNNFEQLSETAQEAIKIYEDVNNIDISQRARNFIRGNDNNRTYVYKDKDGNEKEVYAEEIIQTAAASKAMEELGVSAKKAADSLNAIDNKVDAAFKDNPELGKGVAEALKGYLETGNLELLSLEEQEAMAAMFGGDGVDADELRTLFPTMTDEEIAQALGVKDIDQAVQNFNNALDSIPEALANVSKTLSATPKMFFDALDNKGAFKDMSVKAKKQIADMYQEIFNEGGVTGLTILSSFIDGLGEQSEIFAEHLGNIDWNSATPESLIDYFEDYGMTIESDMIPQMQAIINLMKEINKINLSTATKMFKELSDAANNIKAGDTLTDEEYKELIANDASLSQYFTKTVGGYMMTDTTGQFASHAEQSANNAYAQAISGLQDQIIQYENALQQDYDSLKLQASFGSSFGTIDFGGQQTNLYDSVTANYDYAQKQYDYLKATGYGEQNAEKMAEWQAAIDMETLNPDIAREMADAIIECGDSTEYFNEQIEKTKADMEAAQEAINFANYTDRISDLGLEFEFTQSYAKALEEQMKASGQQYDNLEEAAKNLAIANQRLDRGINDLSNNLDNYEQQLVDTNRGTVEYQRAMEDLKTNIADIFNTDKSLISNKFIEEQLLGDPKKLKELAKGNMKIVNSMRKELAKSAVIELETRVKTENLEQFKKAFAVFEATFPDLEVGAFIHEGDEAKFIASLNQMIAAAQLTHDEVNALLGSMGMSAKITTINQPVQTQVVETIEEWKYEETQPAVFDNGTMLSPPGGIRRKSITFEPAIATTYQQIPVIETVADDGTSSGGGIDFLQQKGTAPGLAPSAGSGSGGGGGGGGGSSEPAEPIKLTKHSDIVDRYKEVDDALDDVRDSLEDVEKISDRLYGVSRISGIKKQNEFLQEEIKLLKQKKEEAQAYLAVDKQELANAAAKAGVSVTLDGLGNVSNYTASMNKLFDELHAAEVYWNNTYHGKTQEDQQKYQEEVLDPIKEKIDDFKDAVSQYDETRELIEDIENEIDDKFYEWQDNNYEILHYTLEIELELNELNYKEIDYYLNKLKDDFYAMGEAIAYMNSQVPFWLEDLSNYETFYEGIKAAFGDGHGDISQLDFVEGMKEGYEGILETLDNLNELDKEMKKYYGETLEAANEELQVHIDHFESLTTALEHYQEIITLINGEMDYARIGSVLEGKTQTINAELQVLKANYLMLMSEKKAIQESIANAEDDAELAIYEEELEAITKAVDEAQDALLSKTEEWAEAMKAVLENTIAAAGKELEDAFTNGMGFDALSNSLDRLSTFQDEYLTKVNQVYETQKMIRDAQQAADKTDNQASKIKLKAFMEETQQLQNKNQMSKLDLEIQQARYELLLAEIALQDAQNAKSTVRLQRDNEGNFGYVYTADQENISQKEQELADAENALYNIGLEAANDYGQRRLELQQQLADELIALNERRNNGEFATDALYYAERDRIISEYNNLFMAYSDQYTTALGVNNAIQRDSWIQAYSEMIDQTLNWKDRTTEYLGACEDAYTIWREKVAEENDIVNNILTNTNKNVEDLATESKELSNNIRDELIPVLNQEMIAVRNVTSEYAKLRDTILDLIKHYEELAMQMKDQIIKEAYTDRFEYTKEIGEAETLGGTANISNMSVGELQKLERTKSVEELGWGSVWNELTGQFEAASAERRYEILLDQNWERLRNQVDPKTGEKLSKKEIEDLIWAAVEATSIDEDMIKDSVLNVSGDPKFSDDYLQWREQYWEEHFDPTYNNADDSELIKIYEEKTGNKATATSGIITEAQLKELEETAKAKGTTLSEEYARFLQEVQTKQYKNSQEYGMAMSQKTNMSDYDAWKKEMMSHFDPTNGPAMDLSYDDYLDYLVEERKREIEAEKKAKEAAEKANQNKSDNAYYYVSGTGTSSKVVEVKDDGTFRDDKSTLEDNKAYYEAKVEKTNNELTTAQKSEINNLAGNMHVSFDEARKMLGYKTGGIADFTGPAWLDGTKQKPELVLNQQDTENFLIATDTLRDIVKAIDLNAMSNAFSLNSTPPGLFDEYNQAVEQMVHIEASFPSVQDRNEIEAAFNNLINTASQYANRK